MASRTYCEKLKLHWRFHLVVAAASLFLLACSFKPAFALCSPEPLKKQIRQAAVIFAGTVDTFGIWRSSRSIGTRYRFREIGYIKGVGSRDSLILIQGGGPATTVWSEDEVQFEQGRRYIVLATASRESTGIYHAPPCGFGPFDVVSDTSSSLPVIHVGLGPVALFDGVHLVTVRRDPRFGSDVLQNGYELRKSPAGDLSAVIQHADSVYEEARRRGELIRYPDLEPIRSISLPPKRDPRTRVPEAEFMRTFATMVARIETEERPVGK
jgi:hypothetical protein